MYINKLIRRRKSAREP